MGVETRLILAQTNEDWRESAGLENENGCLWVSIVADFHLGKLMNFFEYEELLEKARKQDKRRYFFNPMDHLDEDEHGELQVTHDKYGNPIQRLEPEDVLEVLKGRRHLRLRGVGAALESYKKSYEDSSYDLIVLHYGY